MGETWLFRKAIIAQTEMVGARVAGRSLAIAFPGRVYGRERILEISPKISAEADKQAEILPERFKHLG